MELITTFANSNNKLLALNFTRKVFVMGNTSADMDSVLSSILLSFALNLSNGVFDSKLNDEKEINIKAREVLYLPLINTEHRFFISKLDIKYLFNLYGIDFNNLIFIDKIGNLLFDNQNVNLILVDHNKLDPLQEVFADKVIAVYDHHEDSNIKYKNLREKHLIYPIGSCSTIILMNYYVCNKEMINLFSNQNLEFLCTAIWLDTKGFLNNLKYERWIDLDLYTFEKISSNGKVNLNVFADLEKNKYNLQANLELGIEYLMSKDLKNFEYKLSEHYFPLLNEDLKKSMNQNNFKVSIKWASLQIGYFDIREKFGEESLLSYFQNQNCDIYITNCDHKRNKIITLHFNPLENSNFNSQARNYFLNNFLKLTTENMIEVLDSKVPNLRMFLMDMKVSRKTLEPIIRKLLEN